MTQRDRFLEYLQTCVKSTRATDSNPLLLGGNAPKDYVRFLEKDRLFDYDQNKWTHISSMYDINDYGKALEVFNVLIADSNFLKRDREDNQGWRRGAISHYVCFLRAQEFFSNAVGKGVSANTSDSPLQQIFYGAPGTGKSHGIKDKENLFTTVIRTTFHPDSDYSTFVGAYKPTITAKNNAPVKTYTVGELTNILSRIKASGTPYPCHIFAAEYWESLDKLPASDIKSIIAACGFSDSMAVEVRKGIVIGQALASPTSQQQIGYKFVSQTFTKAYIEAWKLMSSIGASPKSTNYQRPINNVTGTSTNPYSTNGDANISSFDYSKTDNQDFTTDEIEALKKVDGLLFSFTSLDKFADIHQKLSVVVADKTTLKESITFTRSEVEDEIKAIKKIYGDKPADGTPEGKKYYTLRGLLSDMGDKDSLTFTSRNSVWGLHSHDENTETVTVYRGQIAADCGAGYTMFGIISTYVHEMFHAYFNTPNTVKEIEESIVECCTLCFLELFEKEHDQYNGLFKWYKKKVFDKQLDIVISFYGFGDFLYQNCSLDWIKLYKDAKIDIASSLVNNFKDMFRYGYCPDEQSTMSLLYSILTNAPSASTSNNYCYSDKVLLVIEEINRGNCAQIFGDLFQLLDRNEQGYSEYAIQADEDLRQVLSEEFANINGIPANVKSGEELLLPPNLYIWATMNTSDQSLFPIDSAFKRRWDWKYVPIDTAKENWNIKVNNNNYSWTNFLDVINEKIFAKTDSEDKQLGFYFCKAEGNVISAEKFVGKVLFYIYNDVYKDYGFDEDFFIDKTDNKKLTFRSFYNFDGSINEGKVEAILKNLEIKKTDDDSDGNDKVGMSVQYNGQTVHEKNDLETYVKILELIGVDRIATLDIKCYDQNIVGVEPPGNYAWRTVNNYKVLTFKLHRHMERILNEIAAKLQIDLHVSFE